MVADDKNGHPPEAATGHASLEEIRLKMRELTDQLVPPRLTDEQLLPAVQDLIATMPPRVCFAERIPLIAEWIGEASAVLERWNSLRAMQFRMSIENIGTALDFGGREYTSALSVLHEARHDVELRGEIPTSAFIDKGKVHDYFALPGSTT